MIVDVFQDTVCPWCRIGAKNLQTALQRWDGEPVTVRYRPFELQPGMPAEGRDFRQHMTAIKGDANIEPMIEHVCRAGEACDITFRFDRVQRAPNTLLSHVLVAAVPDDKQEAMLDALHDAYFEHGRDIGDRATLLAIASEQGFDELEIAAKLDDPALRSEVSEQATWARQQGISGVPFFIFDGVLGASGAQPPAHLLQAMQQAIDHRTASS